MYPYSIAIFIFDPFIFNLGTSLFLKYIDLMSNVNNVKL